MSIPPLPKGVADTPRNRTANALHSTAIRLLRLARPADRDTGLSPERLSLLSVLVYAGPQSLGRLAEIEQVSRPAISRIVKALVDAGLVRRERDRRDRRSVTAHATAEGKRLMEAGRRARLSRVAAALEGLSPDDLERLARTAEELERRLVERRSETDSGV
ncbi:MAG: MarR family transcriptional regulator [Thermoanaerobaculia bacterium]|nr:MarR family transcriptional regulator [Thermoanaerobaculia bacterium]